MKQVKLPYYELEIIAGTRAMLGIGLGLVLADQLSRDTRRKVGYALAAIGVVSTVPLILDIWGNRTSTAGHFDQPSLATLAR